MPPVPPPPEPIDATQAHLVLDRAVGGVYEGWAHGPSAHEPIALLVGEHAVAAWPRTIPRPDADASVGDDREPKGFAIDLGAVEGFLALTSERYRPDALLTFAGQRLPVKPQPTGRPLATLGRAIADAWLADSHRLRLRTDGAVSAVTAIQAGTPLHIVGAEGPLREGIVSLPLAQPAAPVLLVMETDAGPVCDLLPFPSLLRGGLHEAETLAMAGGASGLPHLSARLLAAASSRPRRLRYRLDITDATGAEPNFRPAVAALLEMHAERTDGPADLTLAADMVPTLTSLCRGACGGGMIAVDPQPGGERWLINAATSQDLDGVLPKGPPAVPAIEANHPTIPSVIRHRVVKDEGLDPLLFPLAPDAPFADPLPFGVCVVGGEADGALVASLPDGAALVADGESLADLTAHDRPILFLAPEMVCHDRRTLTALARMVGVEGVATAGAMVIGEPRHGDRTALDRVRSIGLMPSHASADQPWRPALARVVPAPLISRANVFVAANDPCCMMAAPAALRDHGGDIGIHDHGALETFSQRCLKAGLQHAVTSWFSVFDRAPSRPAPVTAPIDTPLEGAFTTAMRLM
ncbi:MAG: hypothetical protein AAGD34_08515 [Pseudomonadota bacterium]